MDTVTAKKVRAKYIAPIQEAELAIRILEAAGNMSRPPGMSAEQALNDMEPDERAQWRRCAHAAMEYWRECIESSNASN